MNSLLEPHRHRLRELALRRGVLNPRVFGSMLGEQVSDESDVDLLVTLAPGTSGLALGGLLRDAEELLGRRVDVVTEAALHPLMREAVLRSAEPL
jgi:uncharacterized protein